MSVPYPLIQAVETAIMFQRRHKTKPAQNSSNIYIYIYLMKLNFLINIEGQCPENTEDMKNKIYKNYIYNNFRNIKH